MSSAPRTRPRGALRAVAVSVLLALLLAVPAGTATATASAAASAPAAGERDPLSVQIDRLTPSVMPEATFEPKGRDTARKVRQRTDPREVTVTGSVSNRSEATWSDLSVYLLTSYQPITARSELAAAVASDPRTELGDRIVEPELFAYLPDLAPGDSTRFRLSVPRSALAISGAPGVYWLAVHVLGAADGERLPGADGRARTFLPLVPAEVEPAPLALGLQLRRHTVRAPDGRLESLADWQRTFSDGGRLSRLLAFGSSAGTAQLTWLVDPAVVEAARSVAAGNPPVDLEPEARAEEVRRTEETGGAEEWLARFASGATRRRILSLPYGDLDVASAYAAVRGTLVENAFQRGADVLDSLGVRSSPVVAPPTGYLTSEALAQLDPEVATILVREALPDAATVIDRGRGAPLLLAGSKASVFGPRPGAPRSALAVRQRLLADAALHVLSQDAAQPFVALLPPGWNPGPRWRRARFFSALDVPWLSPVGLSGPAPRGETEQSTEEELAGLVYPEAESEAQLPVSVLATTAEVVTQGKTLDTVLSENDSLGERLGRQALLGSSVWSRVRPGLARERLRGQLMLIQDWFDEITVRAPTFVTMSSERGDFPITVVNGLDEEVRVGLRLTVSGGDLRLGAPDILELAPRERRALRINASADDIGIHEVTLQPVSASGAPLGAPASLSIRTSNVGRIVWLIMAGGGLLLFGAVAVRIVRRVRRRRTA